MARHPLADWGLLLALTAMWGTAFMLTKIAVSVVPSEWVVLGRLAIASLLLLPLALGRFRNGPNGWRLWIFFGLIALLGNALPYTIIAWGQQYIDSALAGILMAVMPLFTLGFAHFFVPGERLNRFRIGGFTLGFAGIVVLTGPEASQALQGVEGQFLPMLAVLGGAVCYAVSAILSRLRPSSDALHAAAATTVLAALMMLPVTPLPDAGFDPRAIPSSAWLAVGALGAFSTALAAVVYFRLIESAGPAFVSLLNYLIPLWALGLGVLFLGEQPQTHHLYALVLILGGIVISRLERGRAQG